MAPKKLIFVNKTAQSKSLSNSSGREKRKIFSHVQRGPDHLAVSALFSSSSSARRPRIPQDDPNGIQHTAGRGSDWVIDDLSEAARIHASFLDELDNVRSPGSAPDSILAAEETADEYMKVFFDRTEHACKLLSADTELIDLFTHAVALAKTDRALRIAIVCMIASCQVIVTADKHHEILSIHFKKLAIHHLRKQLTLLNSTTVPESTILAITLLLWVECVEGDNDHATAHMAGLEPMLSRFTNLDYVPLPLASPVFELPLLCSAMMRTRPVPLPTRTQEIPLPPSLLDKLETLASQDMPLIASRFFKEPISDLLGNQLIELIKRQRFCRIFRQSCFRKTLDPDQEELQAVFIENTRVSYSLVMMAFEQEDSQLKPIQSAVRLAVFMTFQPILPTLGSASAFARSMFRQLREAIEGSEYDLAPKPILELILWLLFVAARIANKPNERLWVIGRMKHLITLLGLETFEAVEELLLGFFYSPAHCRSTLLRVWEDRSSDSGE